MSAKERLVLKFSPEIVEKPITYHLTKDYNLIVNILKARVSPQEEGVLAIAVEGTEEDIERGKKFLEDTGVTVHLWREMIVRDEDRCTHCGACTAVCGPKALYLDRSSWLVKFDEEKCIACEFCVAGCPSRAIKSLI